MYYTDKFDHYDLIGHKLMQIFGIIMCIFGLIGNILNILIFSTWSRPRRNSNKMSIRNHSPLYLLVSSIANLFVILYPLLTRIMFDGYQYRVTKTNVFILCKFRYYALHTFDLISLTCICLAIFDRYLISSRKVYLRELSQTKQQTIAILLLIIILISCHNIPIAIYYTVSSNGQCTIYSRIYLYYYLYTFQIFLHGIIPIIFLTIFGLLTYKQLRILSQNNRYNYLNSDRQLSRMLLLMSIGIILSSIPNCIEQIYDVIFIDSNNAHSSKFYLYHVISSILFYTNPVCSFYIYYISTPNFRYQVRNLCQSNRNVHYLVSNQINLKLST